MSVDDIPVINTEVVFLSYDEGGRKTLPNFKAQPWYRPHIVIQDPMIRVATIDENGIGKEHYLGVEFIDGPEHVDPGYGNQYILRLLHHSRIDYSNVIEGATFTIREGSRIVGFGTVLSRKES